MCVCVCVAFSLLPGTCIGYRWLSRCGCQEYVVVNWTFTSGGVDMRTRLFVNHHHIGFYSRVKFSNFTVGLNHKIF